MGPGFDLEQEQMRARREIEAGDRPALRSIIGFLRISKSSYEYQRARLAERADRDDDIRAQVVATFAQGGDTWGYRTVWARMRRASTVASEKRVPRVMREEGLRPAYAKRCRRGVESTRQPCEQGLPRRRTEQAVAHRHNGVPPAGRPEGLPQPRDRLLRRQAGGLVDRRASDGRVGQLEPGKGAGGEGARGADGDPLGPRWALPLARVDSPMRRGRLGQEHVREGLQPGQLRLRGLLRQAEERVLLLQGLVGRGHRRVHGTARRLPGVLLRGADQAVARVAEPQRVPQKPGLRRLSGPGNRPHPPAVSRFREFKKE